MSTIDNIDKTVAIGNVPIGKAAAFDWLIQISDKASAAKLAFDEAVKATAEKFDMPAADLKAGIKARQDNNADVVVKKLNDKIDVIQEVFGTH